MVIEQIDKNKNHNHIINFSDIEQSLETTKEIILSYVTDKEIFERFLGFELTRNKLIKSPFRNEDNASFSIFKSTLGTWRFNDFTSKDGGDCFGFVQKLLGVDYKTALNFIMGEFNIKQLRKQTRIYDQFNRPFGRTQDVPTRGSLSIDPEHQIVTSNTRINIEQAIWGRKEIDYWLRYAITLKTLSRYHVLNVKRAWFNESKIPLETGGPKMMFAYQFGTKYPHIRYKLYRPVEVSKTKKWYNNCVASDVMGLEQLCGSNKELLIITKSMKDVMVLDEMGYDAIAPQSESTPIPEGIMLDLISQYKDILVLFDNDPAGRSGATRLCDNYGLSAIYVEDDVAKDISDYAEAYGFNKATKLIDTLTGFFKKDNA